MKINSLSRFHRKLSAILPFEVYGYVTKVLGLTIESSGPLLKIGDLCRVVGREVEILAEVVGFKEEKLLLTALNEIRGLEIGARVIPIGISNAPVGESFIGRVVNALGEPLDNKKKPKPEDFYPLYGDSLRPPEREKIQEILDVGIKAINALLTIGCGQKSGYYGRFWGRKKHPSWNDSKIHQSRYQCSGSNRRERKRGKRFY